LNIKIVNINGSIISNIENLNLERIELNLLEKGIFVAIIELDNKSRFLRKLIVI